MKHPAHIDVVCVRARVNVFGVSVPNRVRRGRRTFTRYLPVHDSKDFVEPKVKRELPPEILGAIAKWRTYVKEDRFPLVNGYAMRSEMKEDLNALVLVMLPRMDVLSYRVGRPDRRDPRKLHGLAVDYELAPLSKCGCGCEREISESRIEEGLERMKKLGWLEWDKGDPGRRADNPQQAPKLGYTRDSSQQVEENEAGELRGRAAIRQLTDELFKAIAFDKVMAVARAEKYERAKRAAAAHSQGVKRTRAPRTVDELAASFPDPEARERPPP